MYATALEKTIDKSNIGSMCRRVEFIILLQNDDCELNIMNDKTFEHYLQKIEELKRNELSK